MEIGLYMNTHGFNTRDGKEAVLRSIPAQEMQPVKVAQLAEGLGYHSLWFPDHVTIPLTTISDHPANVSGRRAYEPRHTMLDCAVTMGVVASHTRRVKLGSSVLIAPYRHPLSDARQFATIDVASNGRLLFGVGAGWQKEEYEALGISIEERGAMTEECIQIYKRAWEDDVVSYDGQHYNFANLSMDPKPVQRPRPPIYYGGVSKAGARRAARYCDGFYPILVEQHEDPHRLAPLQDEIRREAEQAGKDLSQFAMLVAVTALPTDADDEPARMKPRANCAGTAEQILEDLQGYAAAGYSLVVFLMHVRSGTLNEYLELVERVGREVIPAAKRIEPQGEWQRIA